MAAKPVKELPIGEDWLYEAKLLGYRVLALKSGERVAPALAKPADFTAAMERINAARSPRMQTPRMEYEWRKQMEETRARARTRGRR